MGEVRYILQHRYTTWTRISTRFTLGPSLMGLKGTQVTGSIIYTLVTYGISNMLVKTRCMYFLLQCSWLGDGSLTFFPNQIEADLWHCGLLILAMPSSTSIRGPGSRFQTRQMIVVLKMGFWYTLDDYYHSKHMQNVSMTTVGHDRDILKI
jgi:hypothetical protein